MAHQRFRRQAKGWVLHFPVFSLPIGELASDKTCYLQNYESLKMEEKLPVGKQSIGYPLIISLLSQSIHHSSGTERGELSIVLLTT